VETKLCAAKRSALTSAPFCLLAVADDRKLSRDSLKSGGRVCQDNSQRLASHFGHFGAESFDPAAGGFAKHVWEAVESCRKVVNAHRFRGVPSAKSIVVLCCNLSCVLTQVIRSSSCIVCGVWWSIGGYRLGS
jgi:hypothetical protein